MYYLSKALVFIACLTALIVVFLFDISNWFRAFAFLVFIFQPFYIQLSDVAKAKAEIRRMRILAIQQKKQSS